MKIWSTILAAVLAAACQSSSDGAGETNEPGSAALEPAPPSGGTAEPAEVPEQAEAPAEEEVGEEPTPPAEEAPAERAHTGRTCTTTADCGPGETCFGPEGCDVRWTCVPGRRCTRDRRPYCTCDGRTVHGSGSCPPEPYAKRGPC